jgi:CelD/BcsL family acetyltransferase involved in cellulose biosynthesis
MQTTSGTSTRSERSLVRAPLTGAPALRTVRFADLDARDLAAWSELAARAVERNPFFEPEAVVPAAALYGDVELGLIESGGELVGALPLRRTRRWRRVPASSLATWLHPDSYLGSPLLAPEAPRDAIGALLDQAGAGLVAFEWIATGGPVEAAVRAAAADRGLTPILYESFERASLERRPEPTYLSETLSKHRARELRRHRRQLAEQLGGPVEVQDRAGDRDAVEAYLRAEAAGWKAREGTHFARSPEYADFFRAVCDRFFRAGRLQLLVLSCGGTDIAWKVNFVSGDAVFCFKIAYDPAFSRYSPGVQLELDFVDLFHGTPSTWCDSCAAPDNAMINRLWPDRRSLATLLVPTGGRRGAAARQSVRTVMAARRLIRRTDDHAA